jgi:hypothetical protein
MAVYGSMADPSDSVCVRNVKGANADVALRMYCIYCMYMKRKTPGLTTPASLRLQWIR